MDHSLVAVLVVPAKGDPGGHGRADTVAAQRECWPGPSLNAVLNLASALSFWSLCRVVRLARVDGRLVEVP